MSDGSTTDLSSYGLFAGHTRRDQEKRLVPGSLQTAPSARIVAAHRAESNLIPMYMVYDAQMPQGKANCLMSRCTACSPDRGIPDPLERLRIDDQ